MSALNFETPLIPPLTVNITIDGSPPTTKQINNINEYIELILDNLKIEDLIKIKILAEFSKYNDEQLYKITTKITTDQIGHLISHDIKINKLIEPGGALYTLYDDGIIKDNWDRTMENLARLQGLIILRKLVKNCDSGINELVIALDNKLEAVNSMIESQLK